MVAPRVAQITQGVAYARLEDGDRLRKTPTVKRHELLGQGSRRLLSPDLGDGLQVFGHLPGLVRRYLREYVALEVDNASLPLGAGKLAEACQSLVSLEKIGNELAFPVSWNLQSLYLACGGRRLRG